MTRIIVDGVCKEFKIGFRKNEPALARLLSLFSEREPKRTLRALHEVSFKVEAGEILGIIGVNGCGKSTLLRIIAGIYDKDKGSVYVNGNIISLINLYIGLKGKLTMTDNIYLLGSFFGMSRKALKERFDMIVEFSELKDFINTKVYQFSSGMMSRLVFSIAVHCNPDVLLLDEIFEVGDEHFRLKSGNLLKEFVENGVSIILVSHDLPMLENRCDRVIWLDKGRIIKEGAAGDVVTAYRSASLK